MLPGWIDWKKFLMANEKACLKVRNACFVLSKSPVMNECYTNKWDKGMFILHRECLMRNPDELFGNILHSYLGDWFKGQFSV